MSDINLKELLSKMTTKQKIGQLVQLLPSFYTKSEFEITGPLDELGITPEETALAGSNLGIGDAEGMIEAQNNFLKINPNNIPMIFMRDVIHGFRTIYPVPIALGCSFDTNLVEECSQMAALEASYGGVQVTFTPMVDCIRDARWGRVMESCSEDTLLNSHMGAAQVRGFQGDDVSKPGRIAACVKHFAGYSVSDGGRDYNSVEISERSLRQYHFPSYKACIDAGVKMLMPSFNNLNGIPSVANKWLMNDVLKDEWGFKGIVISDYAAVMELTEHGVAENLKQAALMSFESGCDIEMMSSAYMNHLEELINEGKITVEALDKVVLKILEFKKELGLFDNPYAKTSPQEGEKVYLCPKHLEITRRAARESAVLLKNDNVLPLDKTIKTVALIGPFADSTDINGSWSAAGNVEENTTVKKAIETMLPNVNVIYAKGCGCYFEDTNTSGFEEAIFAAKSADAVILCLGEPSCYSGEGTSRTTLTLPGAQLELAKAVSAANSKTATVLFGGRPLELGELHKVSPAILHMWFPGTEGGYAATELLFGYANPCGKLAVSFPKSVGQCPLFYNYTNTGRPKRRPEGVKETYRSNYIDCGNLPQYFFGYGLSYTDFTYESLKLSSDTLTNNSSIKVYVTVKNTGNMAGKETVQLYLKDLVSSAVRPVQELVAYKKIFLEKGESKTIEFEITEKMLCFWNFNNEFISEKGDFEISVGYANHMKYTEKFKLI